MPKPKQDRERDQLIQPTHELSGLPDSVVLPSTSVDLPSSTGLDPINPGVTDMALDPYVSCPCGSGKKFKWCCAPYYPEVEKAFELERAGPARGRSRGDQGTDPQARRQARRVGILRPVPLQLRPDREEAEEAVGQALKLNPNFGMAHFLRGPVPRERGRS